MKYFVIKQKILDLCLSIAQLLRTVRNWQLTLFVAAASVVFSLALVSMIYPGLSPKIPIVIEMDSPGSTHVKVAWGNGNDQSIDLLPSSELPTLADKSTHELKIEVHGEKNEASRGAEVWLTRIVDDEGNQILPEDFIKIQGWNRSDEGFMTPGGTRAILKWRGDVRGLKLLFLSHPWSGKATILWDGKEHVLDLYSESVTVNSLILGPVVWEGTIPATSWNDLRVIVSDAGRSSSIGGIKIGDNVLTGNLQLNPNNNEIIINKTDVEIYPSYFYLLSTLLVLTVLGSLGGLSFLGISNNRNTFNRKEEFIEDDSPSLRERKFRHSALIIFGILSILSLFLIYVRPESDLANVFIEAVGDNKKFSSPPTILWAVGRNGVVHSVYEPGPTILYRLLFRVGEKLGYLFDHPQISHEAFGYGLVQLPHFLLLPVVGLLIYAILYEFGISLRVSAFISTWGLISTILPVYCGSNTRDGLGIPVTLAAFYCLLRLSKDHKKRLLWALFAGLFAGSTALIKIVSATVLIPLAVYILLVIIVSRMSSGKKVLTIALFGCGVLICLGVLFYDRWVTFGIIGVQPPSPAGSQIWNTSVLTGIFGLLFSTGHGVFWFNPILFCVPWAIKEFIKDRPYESIVLLGHTALLLGLSSSLSFWDGWWSWGPRFMLPAIIWLLILVGYWLGKKKKVPFSVKILIGLGILVQLPILIMTWEPFYIFSDFPAEYRQFLPQYSPIIVLWKILISSLTSGRVFSNGILYLPNQGLQLIEYSDFFFSPPWSFWYQILYRKLNILPVTLILSAMGLLILLKHLNKVLSTKGREEFAE